MATMYEISVPVYIRRLNGLAACLKKAKALYDEKKYDEGTLVNYRLYPDMFTLARQVQQATDHARNSTGLLAGVDAPKVENTEKSLADLVARVEGTIAWLKTVKPEQVNGTEAKEVTVKMPDRELKFTGMDLLQHRSLPNFYFHVTTAYDIMRHNGVDLGKRDFMGAA
ncbi:MAG: DUF1993 domain-containing protein [Burkholderiales bacterium]|nr:DUF1993 domain-containing protein [Burkholderiales bacterium]